MGCVAKGGLLPPVVLGCWFASKSSAQKEVYPIPELTLLLVVISILGLMIAFATLVLKIVEVARHK